MKKKTQVSSERIALLIGLQSFKSQIGQGPCYICVACNRLYWRSVIDFCVNNYNVPSVTFTSVKSFDDFKYFCKTCNSKVYKNRYLVRQYVTNLAIQTLERTPAIQTLERILV